MLAEAARLARAEHEAASRTWRLYDTFDRLAATFEAACDVYAHNVERGYTTNGDCAKAILALAQTYVQEAIRRD